MATLHFSLVVCLMALVDLQMAQEQSCALSDIHAYCGDYMCSPENRIDLQSNGEADPCRTGFRTMDNHIFPEDYEIMFDSWDYGSQIIGNGAMFLSREFDNDGPGNLWFQSGGGCGLALRACEYLDGPQDNWLFSEHIKYPAGSSTLGGGHPTEVFVNVSFSFLQCSFDLSCSNNYATVYKYDANSIASVADRTNRNNYIPLFGEGTENTTSRYQHDGESSTLRRSDSFIPSGTTGFHLGIRDMGTCGQINRMIIYYRKCTQQEDGLVYYPELVYPPEGSPPNEADACCAANAHPTTSLTFRAYSNGTCERNVTCECDAGYILSANGMECEACPAGTYRSENDSQDMCLSCPQNTLTDEVAAAICECSQFYFRAENEGPGDACTTPPGPPGPPMCSSATGTSVTVQWTPPSDTGGRPPEDICYIVEYQHISSTEEFIESECIYDTMYTISALEPITGYRINVISENSVSNQDTRPDIARTVNTACETGEGVPETPTRVEVVVNSVFLWQPPAKPNGVILGYQVQTVFNTTTGGIDIRAPIDLDNSTFVYVFLTDIPANSTATVTVRAMTSAGFGESSSPITFEPFAPVTITEVDFQRVCTLMDMGLYIGVTALGAVIVTAGIFLIGCCLCCLCRKYCCKKDKAESYDISTSKNGYTNSMSLTEKVNWT